MIREMLEAWLLAIRSREYDMALIISLIMIGALPILAVLVPACLLIGLVTLPFRRRHA